MNRAFRLSTSRSRTSAAAILLASMLVNPGFAGAKTFVIPHILEKSGTINSATDTYDTNLYITCPSGLAGLHSGLDHAVSLWLFGSDGTPLRAGSGQSVCAPCAFTLTEGGPGITPARKLSIRVDDLIVAKGGFGPVPSDGFAVIDISNDGDPNQPAVAVHAEVVLANTGPTDLAVFSMDGASPCPTSGASTKAFVLPHVLEKSGLTSSTPFTFDTQMFMTYASGLGGLPAGAGATADLYLYNNDSSPMTGAGGVVCNPCTYDFTPAIRKRSVVIDDLITAAGGFNAAVKLGFGILVVGGSDPDGVNLQGFVVNSHTSAFDLSVFGFDPQPISAATTLAAPPSKTGDLVLRLSSLPNPSRGGMDFAFDLARDTHVSLEVYDATGRRVATVFSGNREAGRHTVRWNRSDDAGNPLAAGVYFGRIAAGDGTGLSRIVMLPE